MCLPQQQQQQQHQFYLRALYVPKIGCSTAASTVHYASSIHQEPQPQHLPGQTLQQHTSQQEQQQQQQHGLEGARVLDGKAVALAWSEQLQQQVPSVSRALGRPPGLAVVLVGARPDSMLYVTKKEEACMRIGINCRVIRLPESVSQAQLQRAVADVAADAAVDGVLVQLPLPRHLDEEAVMGALDPRKDVDGFHPLNMACTAAAVPPCSVCANTSSRMLMRGRARRFVPATPLGVVELLSRSGVSLAGKTAVVLGDSNIVGTPLAALLRDEGAALVTICHRPSIHDCCHASQLPAICRTADVLVVAVGSPELVKGHWVKPGAVVVDVGINVVPLGDADEGGVGNVSHVEVAGVASVLTPVPGGVGPMTIAAVLHNTLQAARYAACMQRW
ncbi:5,10-methylenetetrahydrofolate dehydrogenase [Scenedesmus sp. NREL 46B-D3]|nr:5,10-methylenetetrahydrofolate dehydrogenase [Scenedesmus sp. NREL 46B-D3]